jgi:hypothetical protein
MTATAASLAGGTLGGSDSVSFGASAPASPARLQQQLQVALLQQAYLAQMQTALLRQQASAARKAELRERQLANRRARREAELARRSGNAPPASQDRRANALAAAFN